MSKYYFAIMKHGVDKMVHFVTNPNLSEHMGQLALIGPVATLKSQLQIVEHEAEEHKARVACGLVDEAILRMKISTRFIILTVGDWDNRFILF